MNENEAHPRAAVMLADAGWTPHPKWGVYTRGTLVMGGDRMGGFHVKDWGLDLHGPDTPDTPEEAAAWLVQRFAIPADVVTYADHDDTGASDSGGAGAGDGDASVLREPDAGDESGVGASGAGAGNGADRDGGAALDETHGETGEEAAGEEPVESESAVSDDAANDSGDAPSGYWPTEDASIDADFSIPDLPEIELIPPDGDPDFGAELLEFEGELSEPKAQEAAQGPIAYAASDFDALIREKTGRVSQIARGLKAELQEGWTLDEYASLQNQIVMMDRGQMPDDPVARERFVFISQRSQAMSRVDAVRDGKEATLEDIGRRRNYPEAEAFDPESDWP